MRKFQVFFLLIVSCFAQTNTARMLSGINAQTGTSYTFVAADSTRLTTFSNSGVISATLPSGITANFGAGALFSVKNLGVGNLSITCSGCTINGIGSLVLTTGQGADLYSDGVNYIAQSGSGGGGGGGGGNVSTTPGAGVNQSIVQQAGTTAGANIFENIRYVDASWNWLQTDSAGSIGNLSSAGVNTLTFTPCPLGVNGSDTNLFIYISFVGTAEPAPVTTSGGAGTCTPGAATGTVKVTTVNTHSAGFKVGSASSGIYEALKDATATNANNAHIILPPTNPPGSVFYSVFAPVLIAGGHIEIEGGSSATIDCNAKDSCFKTTGSGIVRIHGFRVASHTTYAGVSITNTACASNVATITSTLNPDVGASVDIQMTFNKHYWGVHTVATTSASSWTYTDTNCGGAVTIASAASAGGNAYLNAFASIGFGSNGAGSEIYDIIVDQPGGFTATVNNLVVVGNDQGIHIHDISMGSSLSTCDSKYCANLIYAPGPFSTNAGVLQIDHIEASLTCKGNGVTAYNGNTVSVSDSVIQGFNEWAVAGGIATGGFGPFTLSNVYNEVGSCSNPFYSGSGLQLRGMAGLALQGSVGTVRGGEGPVGNMPQFAATGNGNTQYDYWLVVHDSGLGVSVPLNCGYATVDSVSPAGTITVQCPRVSGTNTITYDLLRNTGAGNSVFVPYNGGCGGGSTTACGSVLTAQAQCSTTICSFTDTASASTSSYAVANATYGPFLSFWPGSVVIGNSGDNGTASVLFTDSAAFTTNISPIISILNTTPTVFAHSCTTATAGAFVSCLAGTSTGNSNPPVVGTLLQNGPVSGGSSTTGQKGRLNFINPPGSSIWNQHLITLVDSNAAKTLATTFYRPSNDANDTFIGLDNGSVSVGSAQLSIGAPVSISQYIANVGDGTLWKERLTSTLKTFALPIVPDTAGGRDIGTTALPWGNIWLGTAATNNFKFQPAATAAARVISMPDPLQATNLGMNFNATNGVYQSKRGTAGCTTSGGATPFTGPCTTVVTFPASFADTNFSVTCMGRSTFTGVPLLQGATATANNTVTVQTQQATGVNASFATIDCLAVHD